MTQASRASASIPQEGFLFLQGPSSSLFVRIADKLEAAGARCFRINLNTGDWIFWRRNGAINYRGDFGGWRNFVRRCIEENGIRNVVLHGEERPYHRTAIEEARQLGAAVYVVEMGYLRPDWVTLEREGLSSNSRFPADAAHIVRVAEDLPEPDWRRHFNHTFFMEAVLDLLYYLPVTFIWFLYPHYRRHGLFHPLAEYAGWLLRLSTGWWRTKRAVSLIEDLAAGDAPFFVYPLQLQTDYQLRAHSPYKRQQDAILQILRSFATHAPPDARLVMKIHPLDNGLIAWKRYIESASAPLGLRSRVSVIDGGNLNELVAASRGMVTVNSTAALSALQADTPVKVLGTAIYDIAGLTDKQPLDGFWRDPKAPSPDIRTAFLRLLAASIQVRGNFYDTAGVSSAADQIAERLISGTVNMPDAFVEPPPRPRPTKIDV